MVIFDQGMSDALYYKTYGTGEAAIKARIRAIYTHEGNTTVTQARIDDIYNRRKAELAKSFDTLRADIDKLTPDELKAAQGQTLNNVPGKPQVWKVGNKTLLVYTVPGTEADPVYLTWEATSQSDIQSWFGPGKPIVYSRTMTDAQYNALGALDFGSTDEIPAGDRDPFAAWANTLEVESQTQPWILDDDYQALLANALVEGRELTDAEIASTQWWKTHNAAERKWLVLFHSDAQSANDLQQANRIKVRDAIIAAGGGTTFNQDVVNYMADRFTAGNWTSDYLNAQIRAVTDSYSGIKVDAALTQRGLLGTVAQTNKEQDTVRAALSTWLGPAFGNWSDEEIAREAGLIRNDPNEEARFIESLKDQRMALYPMYTDRETSYAAISNVWKQWWLGQWGQAPDETDNLFQQVLKNNDTEVSGQLLRREGLARGVSKVTASLSEQSLARLGDSARKPINA